MGFYGNITNTSKTNFVFDKIYSNRFAMDSNTETDGVFIGRYVLIEYGTITTDSFIKAYGPDSDGWYYTSINQEETTRIKYTTDNNSIENTNIYKNMIIYIQNDDGYEYLICSGGKNSKPSFTEANVNSDLYFYNKNQDIKYQNSRGYDGTVWVKTSVKEDDSTTIKYVNIAELNSVVPSFDIIADAPTLTPITPHFDTGSTNTYYKMHLQPSWGLKVKASEANSVTSDGKTYSSDETVLYTWNQYDPNTNQNEIKNEEYAGAIYYNDAGFNVEESTIVDNNNKISILPTGKSGVAYNNHTNDGIKTVQPDIQEIVIQLPSIGNTIANVWNVIYGKNDENIRYRDIEWKYTNDSDIDGDSDLGGMTRNLETVAGCINSVHDLMGMIIYNGVPDINEADENLIYKDGEDYYRIGVGYEDTIITEISDKEYYVQSDSNNVFTPGMKWNNEVKIIPDSVVLISREETKSWIKLDLAKELETIHGWILKLNKYFSDDKDGTQTRNRETLAGSLNYLNDIIDKFDKLVPGEFVVVDEYGRMQSAGYTTSQVYTSKNYGKSIDGKDTDNYSTTEDRWIGVDMNTSYENPYITITHNYTPVESTTTVSDKNDPTDKDGINNNTEDEIYLYTPIVDAKGHVVGKNTETVTLPYGYKTIATNGRGTSTDENASTTPSNPNVIAENTQDTLNINSGNKWIRIDTDSVNDIVTFSHDVHAFETSNKDTTDLNDGIDTITIQDTQYDNAGHMTHNQNHTYTLPYGYKVIEVENSDDVSAAPADATATPTADNTQDTLKLNASNKWIKFNTKDDTDNEIQVGHILNQNTGDANKDFGLSSDMTIQEIDDNNNQFNIPVIQFDEAGHIIKAETHKVQLPNGFTTFTSTISNIDNTDSAQGKEGSFSPDTMTDTITLAEGNRWINIEASEDTFTFKHYVQDFNNSSDNYDFNDSDQSSDRNSFVTTDWSKDRAGHLIAGKDITYILPNGIKTLSIKNNGKDKVDIETSSVGNLTADNLVDTMTIDNGNRWLGMVVNNKELKLYHNAPNSLSASSNTTSANDNSAKTIAFNSTFEIPQVKYDETGHIFAVDKHVITLDGTNNLVLNNYSKGNNKDAITTNETLNGAFGKLENRLDVLQANSTTEGSVAYQIAQIVNENANGNIDTLNEIASWIVNDTSGAAKMANDIATLKGTDTIDGSVKKSIKDAMGALGSAAFTASTDYATADQGAKADSAIQLGTKFTYGEEGKTIQELIAIIQELEARIEALEGSGDSGEGTPDEGTEDPTI